MKNSFDEIFLDFFRCLVLLNFFLNYSLIFYTPVEFLLKNVEILHLSLQGNSEFVILKLYFIFLNFQRSLMGLCKFLSAAPYFIFNSFLLFNLQFQIVLFDIFCMIYKVKIYFRNFKFFI